MCSWGLVAPTFKNVIMKNKQYRAIDVTKIATGKIVVLDRYWLCKDGDPSKAIFYNSTPQCNASKSLPDRLLEYTEKETGWDVSVVFIKIGYKPSLINLQ